MTGNADVAETGRFSVAVHFFRLLTDYVSLKGLPPERLLSRAGITRDISDDPNGRVPFVVFDQLCEIAASMLGDPCLGLKLGQSIRAGHLGSHGYALMSCSDGAELMRQHMRYSALTIDAAHVVFERQGGEFVRYWRSNLRGGASLGRLQDELNQATTVTLSRWFLNRDDLSPNWVSFRHPAPADVREYEALFRCPVRFGAAETAMGFDAGYVTLPLPHADTGLRQVMDDLCAKLATQLGTAWEPGWLAAARKAVLESFERGEPDIDMVAQAAGMTAASLKGQLSGRGLSFRGLVDDLRRALALGYTRDPGMSLVDIAYLLGFSEQSAFQRAFKRWTGVTPGEYRRSGKSVAKAE